MLDRERILSKIDSLEGYLRELQAIVPGSYSEYLSSSEKRRACERLLQISVECVLDICSLFVAGLRLGLPAEESDLIELLCNNKVLSADTAAIVRSMKGFRNILVHDYAGTDTAIIHQIATERLMDFERFIKEVLGALRREGD